MSTKIYSLLKFCALIAILSFSFNFSYAQQGEGYTSSEEKPQKVNSLSGQPFGKRITYGGNFQINRQKPVAVDLGSFAAYKINKNFIAGVGAAYRHELQWKRHSSRNEEVYGFRAFAAHNITRGFFGHGEYELMQKRVDGPNSESRSREFYPGVLAGLGKSYKISQKLKGQVILLYNFTHEPGGPYLRPWVLRFGIIR